MPNHLSTGVGDELNRRLDLRLNGRSGNNWMGSCIACESSDAFSLERSKGLGHCFSCDGKWGPFQIAEQVLGDRKQAIDLTSRIISKR